MKFTENLGGKAVEDWGGRRKASILGSRRDRSGRGVVYVFLQDYLFFLFYRRYNDE